ncbi:MAG: phosphate acyltransferase [Actinobacteria bacterium]|nr:phosphate acyltransferase [Actinomycetota bacterium]
MQDKIIRNEFEEYIVSSIKGYNKDIVYPDGEDIRLAHALKIFKNFNNSKTILIGKENIINGNIKECGIINTDTIEIIEPSKSRKFNDYKNLLIDLFKSRQKEITEEQAEEMILNNNYFAALMIKSGDAQCGISGSLSSTEAMLRPLIQIIQAGQKKRYLSAAVLEIIPNCPYGLNGQFLLADVGIIPEPNEEQLLDITLLSYETAKAYFKGEPKIAMLSYSTKGSSKSEKIDQIKKVVDQVKKINPQIKIDGELQFDAAVFPDVAQKKSPDSEVAGQANVLIFPELNSANITLKAIHRLANAGYYGSTIQGAAIPFNDTTRGCLPIDLVWLSGMTLMQLKRMEQNKFE